MNLIGTLFLTIPTYLAATFSDRPRLRSRKCSYLLKRKTTSFPRPTKHSKPSSLELKTSGHTWRTNSAMRQNGEAPHTGHTLKIDFQKHLMSIGQGATVPQQSRPQHRPLPTRQPLEAMPGSRPCKRRRLRETTITTIIMLIITTTNPRVTIMTGSTSPRAPRKPQNQESLWRQPRQQQKPPMSALVSLQPQITMAIRHRSDVRWKSQRTALQQQQSVP